LKKSIKPAATRRYARIVAGKGEQLNHQAVVFLAEDFVGGATEPIKSSSAAKPRYE